MTEPVYRRRLSAKRTRYLKKFVSDVESPSQQGGSLSRQTDPNAGTVKFPCPPDLDFKDELNEFGPDHLTAVDKCLDDNFPPRRDEPYGISLSGGGIRSASYCLGVLQEMTRRHMLHLELDRTKDNGADFLSSVSGGSYIAGAVTMINRGEYPPDPKGRPKIDLAVEPGSLPAFAQTSPEERYLRDHTRYLTHGFGGIFGLVWRLIAGIGWNVVILSLSIGLFAVPLGWLYGALVPSLRSECPSSCGPHHFDFPGWIFYVAVGLAVGAFVLAMAWVGRQWKREGVRRTFAIASLICLGLAAVWLLAVVAIPLLLEWIRASVGVHSTNHQISSRNSTASIGAVAGAGTLTSALVAIFGVRALRTAQQVWAKVPGAEKQALTTRSKSLLLKLRVPLLNLLTSLIAPVTIAAIMVLGLHLGALYRPFVLGTGGVVAFVVWASGTCALLALWWYGDINSWSMHFFYRERLSATFALKRFLTCKGIWSPTATSEGDREIDATRRPYDRMYPISESQSPDFPEFLICASANISKYGATPTNSPVTSFVFSRREVGGPVIGAWPSVTYENIFEKREVIRRDYTLPGAVAMSGAAIAPEMGSMTKAPLRFLLTMFNLRLGLWIPNPNRLAEFAVRRDLGSKRRLRPRESKSRLRQRFSKRRLRPRFTYLFREMFGKDDPETKFIYVTDGGHYENLGVVELIRRHCRYIWCVDASGEQQSNFSTIAGAAALAFSELGYRVDIDPAADMAPVPSVTEERAALRLKPVVKRTFSIGTVFYDENNPTDIGRIVVIKCGVPADAPEDVMNFYESDTKSFPCDSTLDQLYTADRFDAYRSLGAFAADQALNFCWRDFSHYLAYKKPSQEFIP